MRFIVDAKDPGHVGRSFNADALIGFGRAYGIIAVAQQQLTKLPYSQAVTGGKSNDPYISLCFHHFLSPAGLSSFSRQTLAPPAIVRTGTHVGDFLCHLSTSGPPDRANRP